MAKVTFHVQTQWESSDGFRITLTGKNYQIGGQPIESPEAFKLASDFPAGLGGMSKGPTVCEMCMARVSSCISQAIVAYVTLMVFG